MTIRAVIADGEVDEYGVQFSEEALRSIAQQAGGKVVTLNFDKTKPVGRVVSSQLVLREESLRVEVEIELIPSEVLQYGEDEGEADDST